MLASACAFGQSYPSKPIKFIIGFPAASSIDLVSRIVLDDVRVRTGANIVIENRPGALGVLGMDAVSRAPADGYTLAPSSSATHSSGPHLLRALQKADPVHGFTHIGRLVQFDIAVVTSSGGRYKNARALVDAAKSKPDTLTYGYGSGTGQVGAAAFSLANGIRTRAVPYKGQPAAITDLIGGQIDFVASDLGAVLPLVKQGTVTAVAVMADQRSTVLPDVPTAAELGIASAGLRGWIGVYGPAGLPSEVTSWWTNNLQAALSSPQVQERLHKLGMEPAPLFGEAFGKFVAAQYARWGGYVQQAGIQQE
jgi:tripartite-type tricarboxylate transporter receptor subunit TctC